MRARWILFEASGVSAFGASASGLGTSKQDFEQGVGLVLADWGAVSRLKVHLEVMGILQLSAFKGRGTVGRTANSSGTQTLRPNIFFVHLKPGNPSETRKDHFQESNSGSLQSCVPQLQP